MWKHFWKSSIGLGDIASWNVLVFLKIVTKWREIQKPKLNDSPTYWVFEKFFSHLFLSRHVLSKLFICFAIPWNFNFAVNLVTSFSRQKPLKSKNKKHRIFWNTEFYHPAKFELKRIKNAKVVTTLQLFACVLAQRDVFISIAHSCKISLRQLVATFNRLNKPVWKYVKRRLALHVLIYLFFNIALGCVNIPFLFCYR